MSIVKYLKYSSNTSDTIPKHPNMDLIDFSYLVIIYYILDNYELLLNTALLCINIKKSIKLNFRMFLPPNSRRLTTFTPSSVYHLHRHYQLHFSQHSSYYYYYFSSFFFHISLYIDVLHIPMVVSFFLLHYH